MNPRGIIASSLLPFLSEIANPKNSTQFNLVIDFNSNRVNDFLVHKTIPITSHENLNVS